MAKKQSYIKESYEELVKKVTWPSWSELQNSTIIVAIATIIIALIIYLMDTSFSKILSFFYSFFN